MITELEQGMKKYVLLLCLICILQVCFGQESQRRIALVIGNSAYNSSPLANPVNDARAMESTLRDLGFSVTPAYNVRTYQELVRLIRDFGTNLQQGGVGLFYYAGHGIQFDGKNYLIPTQADIRNDNDIELEGVNLDRVLSEMQNARNETNIIIMDACRNNPYSSSLRSAKRGLANISRKIPGCLIAYSTEPDGVAYDGDGGRNGIYTEELIKAIRKPNISIIDALMEVRAAVLKRTNNNQMPWDSSALTEPFYFRKDASEQSKPAITHTTPTTAPRTYETEKPLNPTASMLIESQMKGHIVQNEGMMQSIEPGKEMRFWPNVGENVLKGVFDGKTVVDTIYVFKDDLVRVNYTKLSDGNITSTVEQSKIMLLKPQILSRWLTPQKHPYIRIKDINPCKTIMIVDKRVNKGKWQENVFQTNSKEISWTDPKMQKPDSSVQYRVRSQYQNSKSDSEQLDIHDYNWKIQKQDWKIAVAPIVAYGTSASVVRLVNVVEQSASWAHNYPNSFVQGGNPMGPMQRMGCQLLYKSKQVTLGILYFNDVVQEFSFSTLSFNIEKEFNIDKYRNPVIGVSYQPYVNITRDPHEGVIYPWHNEDNVTQTTDKNPPFHVLTISPGINICRFVIKVNYSHQINQPYSSSKKYSAFYTSLEYRIPILK